VTPKCPDCGYDQDYCICLSRKFPTEELAKTRRQLADRDEELEVWAKRLQWSIQERTKLEKQIVMLRDLIAILHKGGVMGFDKDGMRLCAEALAATTDLSNCVLCGADKNYEMSELTPDGIKSFTVYKERDQKP
jgi:hypothetical protein